MDVAIALDQQLNRRVPPSEAACLRSHCTVKKFADSTIVVEAILLKAS
jgi:hypothetical protein